MIWKRSEVWMLIGSAILVAGISAITNPTLGMIVIAIGVMLGLVLSLTLKG